MSATVSKLIVIFKDSLMAAPTGLRYRIKANKTVITKGVIMKDTPQTFLFISKNSKTIVLNLGLLPSFITTIPNSNSFEIIVEALNEKGEVEKSLTPYILNANNKELTLSIILPWTYIPLIPNKNKDKIDGHFFEVDYNIKNTANQVNKVKVIIYDIPRKIVLTALKHRSSTVWAGNASKTTTNPRLKKPQDQNITFKSGTNKCNVFVYDVFEEVGISIPWIERGVGSYFPYIQGKMYPPLSKDWHNPKKLAHIFSAESDPMPGDVGAYVANYSDASGHTGIILSDGVTISAGWDKIEVNDSGFRNKNKTANDNDHDFTVFRRYKRKEIK